MKRSGSSVSISCSKSKLSANSSTGRTRRRSRWVPPAALSQSQSASGPRRSARSPRGRLVRCPSVWMPQSLRMASSGGEGSISATASWERKTFGLWTTSTGSARRAARKARSGLGAMPRRAETVSAARRAMILSLHAGHSMRPLRRRSIVQHPAAVASISGESEPPISSRAACRFFS